MIQHDYKSDEGPIYSMKPQDKALNSFLQALKQRKSKDFVTPPSNSKNTRSKLQTVHFSASVLRDARSPPKPARQNTWSCIKRTDRAYVPGFFPLVLTIWALQHAKMHV